MKHISALLVMILVSPSFAVTLIKFRSAPETISVQQFDIESQKTFFKKESNYFDQSINYELGTFEIKNDQEVKKLEADLIKVIEKLETVNNFLKDTKGSSFNELSKPSPHDAYYVLEEFKIGPNSNLYFEIDKIFKSLQGKNKKMLEGISLNQKEKQVSYFKDSKKTHTSKFTMDSCLKKLLPTVCKFKNYGFLYVDPKEGHK